MMSAEKIKELKIQRFQFLNKFHDMVDGSETNYLNYETVGKELGFDKDCSYKIAEYLTGEGLLKFATVGGGMQITHWGVKEVELAISQPDQPTEHFLPVNVINIGTMNNSQIQQGTMNSNQELIIEQSKISEIQEILEKISNSVDQLALNELDKEDLKIELETTSAQLKSSKPKKSIVKECFNSIKGILENAAASALAAELIEGLSQITF